VAAGLGGAVDRCDISVAEQRAEWHAADVDVEMAAAHRRAVDVVAAWFGTTPRRARAHLTWGPTVVVEVVVDDALTVFAKASSEQNVHTEAEAITHVRRAGLPAPEVLGIGTDAELPGERWMITRAAVGVSLDQIGFQAATTQRTLTELADLYASLHRVTLPGFGPLADDGQHGVLDAWSYWQRDEMEQALGMLERAGSVSVDFSDRVRAVSAVMTTTLDDGVGSLLHADLGDRETFIDPDTGEVTGLVDWGSALVGDPLYDLARFVSGGSAEDPRPALAFPVLHTRYLAQTYADPDRAGELLRFYRLHICLDEAAWGHDLGWTPSLVSWAERLVASLA
jgi:aminoglycoside phosphotransferase (APT) family kinase protein